MHITTNDRSNARWIAYKSLKVEVRSSLLPKFTHQAGVEVCCRLYWLGHHCFQLCLLSWLSISRQVWQYYPYIFNSITLICSSVLPNSKKWKQ